MLIKDYGDFVRRSDWTRDREPGERTSIAQYGIAAETGSLVSAVKKKLLAPDVTAWNEPNDEIVEELGDIVWYVAMLAQLDGRSDLNEVLRSDLTALPREIAADTNFRATLDAEDYERFAALAEPQFRALLDEAIRRGLAQRV